MEWADAELWRTILKIDAVWDSAEFRKRQHHIHLVQHSFLHILKSENYVPTTPGDFLEARDLCIYAQVFFRNATEFLQQSNDKSLTRTYTIPWFKASPIRIPSEEAWMHMLLHTQHHRGQNLALLRQLGATPLLVDYITWLSNEKPKALW